MPFEPVMRMVMVLVLGELSDLHELAMGRGTMRALYTSRQEGYEFKHVCILGIHKQSPRLLLGLFLKRDKRR